MFSGSRNCVLFRKCCIQRSCGVLDTFHGFFDFDGFGPGFFSLHGIALHFSFLAADFRTSVICFPRFGGRTISSTRSGLFSMLTPRRKRPISQARRSAQSFPSRESKTILPRAMRSFCASLPVRSPDLKVQAIEKFPVRESKSGSDTYRSFPNLGTNSTEKANMRASPMKLDMAMKSGSTLLFVASVICTVACIIIGFGVVVVVGFGGDACDACGAYVFRKLLIG